MLNRLKQLFCKHIYKLDQKVHLESVTYKHRAVMVNRRDGIRALHLVEGHRYAMFYKCVKCDHIKVEKFEEEVPSSMLWSHR